MNLQLCEVTDVNSTYRGDHFEQIHISRHHAARFKLTQHDVRCQLYLNKTGENHIVKKLIWDNADDILLNEKRLQDNATI